MKNIEKYRKLKINSKNYGLIPIYLSNSENKIGDGYFITKKKNRKIISGFVDYFGNEIIPLEEMELEELFYTKDYNDICMGFKLPNTDNLKYYHIKKIDNIYHNVLTTYPYEEPHFEIREVKENPNFWIFEAINNKTKKHEYVIYSIKDVKLITNVLDEVSFNLDHNPYNHTAYFCKYIKSIINEEEIYHTSLCGFLDSEGNFSSQIYDTEKNFLYDSNYMGGNTNSKRFSDIYNRICLEYHEKYLEKDSFTNDVISDLFNNYNQSDIKEHKQKAKIIPFVKSNNE